MKNRRKNLCYPIKIRQLRRYEKKGSRQEPTSCGFISRNQLQVCFILLPLIFLFEGGRLAIGANSPIASRSRQDDWAKHALRLTGESQRVRRRAIESLKQIPALDAILKTALGTSQRYLALDTIAALQRVSTLSDLFAVASDEKSGAVYLTINTLINEVTLPSIQEHYLKVLSQPDLPAPIPLILLDTLGRMGTKIPKRTLQRFILSKNYEAKSGALYYLRYQLLRAQDMNYLPLLESYQNAEPYQLRIQLQSLLRDLPPSLQEKTKALRAQCQNDRHQAVVSWCEELKG